MARILIVDDSPTEVFQMRKALEAGGFEVDTAADGAEAIRKVQAERPDLILMDIVMPGMDGFRATRQLSKDPDTRAIPIIVITGKEGESDRVWAMRQGAVDVLVKPVSPERLRERAQAALLPG
ncbi:MAG: response regulator [Steroidobacteraceae bacterium]|jgi:twitching motility two-component system response regulator PilH